MVRTLEELHRDQAELLRAYQEPRDVSASVSLLPRTGGGVSPVLYARVAEIVVSDATYGPHLMVVRQEWFGVPPVRSDGAEAPWRCYPSPSRVVGDYAVDEVVRVAVTFGAMMAEKLG